MRRVLDRECSRARLRRTMADPSAPGSTDERGSTEQTSASEQAVGPSTTPDAAGPSGDGAATDTSGPSTTKGTASEKPVGKGRVLRKLGIAALSIFLLGGALAALVYWSIREHDRLMVDGTADTTTLHKEPFFHKGTMGGRYDQYRVPAIITTPKGDLLVFVEARQSADDYEGIELLARRSTDNGVTWSEPYLVHKHPRYGITNPTPIVDEEDGVIWLGYREGRRPSGRLDLRTYALRSDDDGKTFHSPVDIGRGAERPKDLPLHAAITPGPGHGIQLRRGPHAGRLLMPVSAGYDSQHSLRREDPGKSYVIYSDDHGKSWAYSKRTDYGGEAMLVETTTGDVYMLIRTRAYSSSKRMKRYAWSRDGGVTWEPTQVSAELVEPVCQASLVYHPKGGPGGGPAILLVSPSVQAAGRWDKSARRDLTVWVSTDGAKTWPIKKLLHPGGASYSDITVDRSGRLHVVYEVGIKSKPWGGAVTRTSFSLGWLDESLGSERGVPFSEHVYEVYRNVRGPLEEIWHDD